MKIAVLVLGMLGAIGAGFIGMKWLSDTSANADTIRKLEEYEKNLQKSGNTAASSAMSSKMADLNKLVLAAYLLLAGGLGGFATLVMFQMKKIKPIHAGVLLVLCSLVPAFFAPMSLVFSGLMILAGGLCFLVKQEAVAVVA